MAEYIEREALIQQMADNFRQGVWDGCDCGEYQIAETTILCAHAADVVEVKRGRWENVTGGMVPLGDCSECKRRQPVCGTNFCHNCGADMREENDAN